MKLFQKTVKGIGHQDHVILHRLTIFVKVACKKSNVENSPRSISWLNLDMIRVIGEMEPEYCENILENFSKRSGQFSDIIFPVQMP